MFASFRFAFEQLDYYIQRRNAYIVGEVSAYTIHVVEPSVNERFDAAYPVEVQRIAINDGFGTRVDPVFPVMA